MFSYPQMSLIEIFLGCLTVIELFNLLIRIIKIGPLLQKPPPLDPDIAKRLYS